MPKACSSADDQRRQEGAAAPMPMPPTTVTTKASAMIEMSMLRVGGARVGVCRAPPRPASEGAEEQRAGKQQRLVDAERRHHLAILRGRPHQHAEARPVHQKPESAQHQGPDRDQEQLVGRESDGRGCRPAPRKPGRARAEDVERAPDLEHEVLHDQHDAEGGEQLEQLGRPVDAPQQQNFDRRRRSGRRRAAGGQHARPERDRAEAELEQARHRGSTPR